MAPLLAGFAAQLLHGGPDPVHVALAPVGPDHRQRRVEALGAVERQRLLHDVELRRHVAAKLLNVSALGHFRRRRRRDGIQPHRDLRQGTMIGRQIGVVCRQEKAAKAGLGLQGIREQRVERNDNGVRAGNPRTAFAKILDRDDRHDGADHEEEDGGDQSRQSIALEAKYVLAGQGSRFSMHAV